MKYYVVSDVHGFYTPMVSALREAGFFTDTEANKLIVCGDILDRGAEAVKVQEFMHNLLQDGKLIFVRGNHEDLMVEMIENFDEYRDEIAWGYSHHVSNGTFNSALQLSNMTEKAAFHNTEEFLHKVKSSQFYSELIPASCNYYEDGEFIFVHGWIPCFTENIPAWHRRGRHYAFNPDWRNASSHDWETARWFNGMELAELFDIVERGRQIVCGHWHTSYGHSLLERKCSEFGEDADFSPYYGKNVVGIDACTAHSGKVNCIVVNV